MEHDVFDRSPARRPPGCPPTGAPADRPPTGTTDDDRSARICWFADRFAELQSAVEGAVVGRPDAVRLALTALVAGGHLLIDDVPGVGKTSLARAIAGATGTTVRRIQGTPDLLPSDLTGTPVWDPGTRTFEFHPGPVFANVVLVDEINRMSPRTQSALLEVMEERQVSVDGEPRPLPEPFLVLATQNPVDADSTAELPEAQLDRFLLRISMGYPGVDDETEVALRHAAGRARPVVGPVADGAIVAAMVAVRCEVHVARSVARYCVELCRGTREDPAILLGASPRASGALVTAAQGWAAAEARSFATVDDVRAVVDAALAHRLVLSAEAGEAGVTAGQLLARLLDTVPVPRDRSGR